MIKNCHPNLINLIMRWYPELKSYHLPIFAGGFVRAFFAGETPKDLDIYFRSENDMKAFLDEMLGNKWEIVFQTDRAISLQRSGKLVQIITYLYGNPENIIDAFDFTICKAAVTLINNGSSGVLYCHDDFFEHLAGRILIYTGSPLPIASLARAFKYVQRGYHICDENIIAILTDINKKVDFDNKNELERHIEQLDPEGNIRIRVID